MKKYGWTSGTGLGASSSGIINPLHVKVEKRKKRSDAEGGGWADPANKAKILGGQRAAAEEAKDAAEGKGKMSEVIVLENMLENMPDLQEEISAGLGQEIGEECGEKVSDPMSIVIPVREKQANASKHSTVVWSDYTSTKNDAASLSSSRIRSPH